LVACLLEHSTLVYKMQGVIGEGEGSVQLTSSLW
jgi:hypothetical protein